MRIEETHANGAKIVVSGWQARKVVEAWRAAQEPKKKKAEEEQPKVTGTSAYFSGSVDRRYDTDSYSSYAPVVFGFVPNEVNERIN